MSEKPVVLVGVDEAIRQMNNDLQVIVGNSDLLLQKVYGPEDRLRLVEIQSAAQRIAAMGKALLGAQASAPVVGEEGVMPHGNEVILFVNQNDRVRRAVASLLESLGYTVLVASSGEEGLEAFTRARTAGQPVHLVITSLSMPGMHWRTLEKRLHEVQADLPVILLLESVESVTHPQGFAWVMWESTTRALFTQTVRQVLDGEAQAKT